MLSASAEARRLRGRYTREVRRPLHCLLFVAPLVLLYELGALVTGTQGSPARGLLAHSAISGLLVWFGLSGAWVPPVAFLGAMLVWQRVARDPWRVQGWVLTGMVGESLVLMLPLAVLAGFFWSPRAVGLGAGLLAQLSSALGAGAYEELVFRLLLVSGLRWLCVKLLRLWRPLATGVAIALAAFAFALCHFEPIGADAFAWRSFWFRAVAGVYLGVVFAGRGLGVATGCHVTHNVLRVLLRHGWAG
jgi:hypothetical protein